MYVTINENKVYFSQLGNPESSKTILFIHGSTQCAKGLEPLTNLLPEFNNIALDMPGHVRSEGEPLKSAEEMADFITKFIHELKSIDKITDDLTVAGYSLGGCVTLELGLRGIPEIKRIAVLNSCDVANTPSHDVLYAPTLEDFDVMKLFSITSGSNSKPRVLTEEDEKYRASALASYRDVQAGIAYQMKNFEDISIPTLFVVGSEDKIAHLPNVIKLSEMIPNSVLSVIPFHGHLSLLERPDIYAENIRDLIRHN